IDSDGNVISTGEGDTIARSPLVQGDTTGTEGIFMDTTEVTNEATEDTTKGLYGNDITLNLKSENKDKNENNILDSLYKENTNFKVADNRTEEGTFKTKDYKIKFTPDIIYGAANYSSFYGVQGTATLAFSDLLGNHRIQVLTSMVIDLKNSDYAVGYYYLPNRLDLGINLFHTARFLLYNRGIQGDELYRYRNFGLTMQASYPFNRFKRVDGSLSFLHITKENLDDINEPVEERN